MRVGIDLGGTKTEALLIDAAGKELFRKRVTTPRGDYPATLRMIVQLVEECEASCNGQGLPVGIGTPGALSPVTGRIKNSNSTWLIDKPLDCDLNAALKRKVRLANDADCFTLSEAIDGAGAGAQSVFGVILGTGVGGGLVVRGSLVAGPNAITGEWGHNPLPWPQREELPGHRCYCGLQGCIETFCSGPGLTRAYEDATGVNLPAIEIANRATAKTDSVARQVLDLYETRLARALASVINILDPEVIVLGGGMSNIDRIYENIPRLLGQYAFTDEVFTRLVRAKYGDSSGVRGAAWLNK